MLVILNILKRLVFTLVWYERFVVGGSIGSRDSFEVSDWSGQ